MTDYYLNNINCGTSQVVDRVSPNIGFPAIDLSLSKPNVVPEPTKQMMNSEMAAIVTNAERSSTVNNFGIAQIVNNAATIQPRVTELAPSMTNARTTPMVSNAMAMAGIFTEHFLSFSDQHQTTRTPQEAMIGDASKMPKGICSSPITEYLIDESEFVIKGSNFECQQCGYTISSKRRYMMKNHILAEHKGVKHKCNDCNYEGKSRDKLNAHMKRVHFGIKSNPNSVENFIDESEFVIKNSNFECQQCGYTISSKRRYMMKNHILAEHKGVRHKCNECNYEGKSREKLNAHMKRVHYQKSSVNPYEVDTETGLKCEPCEMKHVHFGISSNPYDRTGLQCDKCDFRTNRGMYELNLHIQAEHEGIKHFCSKCSFSSKRKDLVQRHMKQKHLGIVFRCELCTYTSSWKYSLQRHVARSHGPDSGIREYNQNREAEGSFLTGHKVEQNVNENNTQLPAEPVYKMTIQPSQSYDQHY